MNKEYIEDLLDNALYKAMDWNGEEKGMASVGVKWHPYECSWEAIADWSDNTRVVSEPTDNIVDAVLNLLDILEKGPC